MKVFTTFGVGPHAGHVLDRTLQPLPPGITEVREVEVPAGVNPSKLGTWIQRFALDGVIADECPDDMHAYVGQAAALLDNPNVALALDMTGQAAGDKMLVRLGGEPGDRSFLVFGLHAS